uniref:RRM domain-containing protein n=1 Tax=Globodera rostochiensis TaxID=31243 RepID=A0A914H271_GLORO
MSRRGNNVEGKVYVGGLPEDATSEELDDVFHKFGRIRKIWVARRPPGFAFVEFEDTRDAEDAVRSLDGTRICGVKARVELSTGRSRRDRDDRGGGGGGGGGYRSGGGGGGGGYRGGGGGGNRDYSSKFSTQSLLQNAFHLFSSTHLVPHVFLFQSIPSRVELLKRAGPCTRFDPTMDLVHALVRHTSAVEVGAVLARVPVEEGNRTSREGSDEG